MTTKRLITFLVTASFLSLSACTNTTQYGKVAQGNSAHFHVSNDQLISVAEKMARNLISYPTIAAMLKERHPKVAIASIINQTSGEINTNLIEDALVEHLEQSGHFSISNRSKTKRAQAITTQNQLFDSIDKYTAKRIGSKIKTDYLLYGSLHRVIRTKPTSKEVYYNFDLHMLNTKSGKVVWQNNIEILKNRKTAIFGI